MPLYRDINKMHNKLQKLTKQQIKEATVESRKLHVDTLSTA